MEVTSYTYTKAPRASARGILAKASEPTILFEYAYDTAKLAKKEGLFNVFVTNGYMTSETLETINPYLDLQISLGVRNDCRAFTALLFAVAIYALSRIS